MQGVLAHRYEILEHVGGGGMADVYRARDTLLDRFVAVKVLHAQYAGDKAFVVKFRREAQGAAKLSHPNIVNIYDVGEETGKHYIVMEYISGETLKDKIQREGALPLAEALRIAEQIAQGLEHAHQNNLVHCDIKPHNILVTDDGRVKVADFGIARAVSAATMTFNDSVVGSVHYFSPEQAKGGVVGPQSDLYSLGVVLYEMITGAVPFEGETPIGIALKHVQEEPAPLRSLQPAVPAFAETIVARAMAKETEERYASAAEFIDDLKAAAHALQRGADAPTDVFATQVLPKVGEEMMAGKKKRGLIGALKAHLGLVALACILFFGFFFGAFLSYGKIWTNADIAVPDVVGKQLAVGKEILQSENLRVEVTEAYDDQTPSGYIVSQHPEANAAVKEGRLIRLYVSKGGEAVDVPDVRGMLRRDAEIKLKNTGLHLGRISESDSDRVFDTVLEQNPASGAQIAKGSAVDITISKGAAAHKIKLPEFRGTPLGAVKSQLETLGLKLGKTVDQSGAATAGGAIISQNPAAGTEVLAGTSVDFVLEGAAKAQPSQSAQRSYDVALTVPEGAAKQAVRIVVTDENGRRAVYENVHKPGDTVRKTVRGNGDLRVQVYVNGKLAQEQTI